MSVSGAQCIIGTEKYPDSAILLKYDDDYSQGYGQRKEVFRALTHDNILQRYISEDDYRSSNDGVDNDYNIHAFNIRNSESAQHVKVEFKFSENILAGIYG